MTLSNDKTGRTRISSVVAAILTAGALAAACSGTEPAMVQPGGGAGGEGGGEAGGEDACPSGFDTCGDVCVQTSHDERHCGACDAACADGERCVEGTCALSCSAGQQICGGACTDVDTDRAHCGGCDAPCAAGEVCDGSGTCALSCQTGLTDCGGTCVDTDSDLAHCGGCDAACDAGEVCDGSGTCALSCQAGLSICSDACVDTDTDLAHCGGCDAACDAGEVCDGNGNCALVCQAGLTICDDTCVDTDTDRAYCGGCTTACADGEVCNGAGQCEPSCQSGLLDCDGRCVDPLVDLTYCGAALDCLAANAGSTCGALQSCVQGHCYDYVVPKKVFITSTVHGSDFGGLTGADAVCQAHADAANLGGTYMAWLSDGSGSPSTRFNQATVPYALVDGTIVAHDWADLTDGTLDQAINMTELGGAPPAGSLGVCGLTRHAWTNTQRNGTPFGTNSDCTDWTGVNENGAVWGLANRTDFFFTEGCGGGTCTYESALFCFEQ